jgi:putative membrane protein
MVWILIAVSIILIGTDKKFVRAMIVFILSGIFGFIIFNMDARSPIGMTTSMLFPALAGLFGLATLIHSIYSNPQIPNQIIEEEKFGAKPLASIGTGTLSGMLVSILPGVTAAVATIIAMVARGEKDERQTIVTLSAVNTATAFFVLVALFIILLPRSGAAIAVNELLAIEEWDGSLIPFSLCYLLIAVITSAVISYFATRYFGKVAAKNLSKIPYKLLMELSIVAIIIMVFIFTGFRGLFVLICGTIIGLIPINWGIRRSNCMGVLLLPIILNYLI